ncbi:hypothetical protein [Streptosporangium sp. V21-05]|uniref:hypothetical protein n=1 Tax=Streptosporangium sp. V21-05 TaxID=3446115 RepID=UPI003F53ACD7
MPEPAPPSRAQIWAGRTSTRRRFLVTTVLPNGDIRGMTYLEGDSATRTTTLTPAELHTLYQLHEDVPEHLRADSHA